MKGYLGYIRVSTTKQGGGVSLPEQRTAIEAYAARRGLVIAEWFVEMETAAKRGRRQFNRVVEMVRKGRAAGLIAHKIDRSARNLGDWAVLGELIDAGFDVHFAHEGLDLTSRGGRLAADMQAVVAADYVRNLKEEARKGFYGRLKQGLYPLPAPRGYLDCGRGKPKQIDPVEGPLVREAFMLYASGTVSLRQLGLRSFERGLRTRSGKPLSPTAVTTILHNPFYAGVISIARGRETFPGAHEPLISVDVFRRVQDVMSGRVYDRPTRHDFMFRRLLKCADCPRTLTGEVQKGHVYYRCHTPKCRGVSVREEDLHRHFVQELRLATWDDGELGDFREALELVLSDQRTTAAAKAAADRQRLALVEERLNRLTDGLLDGIIDKQTYADRRATLLMEQQELRESDGSDAGNWQSILDGFERGNTALKLYETANDTQRAEILKSLCSNFRLRGNCPEITFRFPLQQLYERRCVPLGGPSCGLIRTRDHGPCAGGPPTPREYARFLSEERERGCTSLASPTPLSGQ